MEAVAGDPSDHVVHTWVVGDCKHKYLGRIPSRVIFLSVAICTGAAVAFSGILPAIADALAGRFNAISERSAGRCSTASICTSRFPRCRIRNCAARTEAPVRAKCAGAWPRLARFKRHAGLATRISRCKSCANSVPWTMRARGRWKWRSARWVCRRGRTIGF